MDEFDTHMQLYRHLPLFASVLQPMALLLSIFAFITPSWLAYEAPRQIIVVETSNNATNSTMALDEVKRLWLRQNTTLETVVGNITFEGNVTVVNTTIQTVAPAFTTGPIKNGFLWFATLTLAALAVVCVWNLWRRTRVGTNRIDVTLQRLGVSSSLIGPEAEREVLESTRVLIYLSAFTGALCITLTLVYSSSTPLVKPGWRYSDGYYNCMQSGILLLCSSALFFFDSLWAGDGFCRMGSGLSPIQTRCLLSISSTIGVMTLVATLFVALEGWHYRDSMFWTITTFTTIGFGANISPRTSLARMSLIPISIMGIALVGFTVRSIAQVIDEATKEGIRLEWTEVMRKNRGDDGALYQTLSVETLESSVDNVKEKEVREKHLQQELITAGMVLLVFWLVASLIFALIEKWSWDESLYFVFVAVSTIGYGDVVPSSPQGLAIFNIFIFIAIGIVTWCASTIAMWYNQGGDPKLEAIKACQELERRLMDANLAQEQGELLTAARRFLSEVEIVEPSVERLERSVVKNVELDHGKSAELERSYGKSVELQSMERNITETEKDVEKTELEVEKKQLD
jgi:hypothetical protein